jgi:hypothetical protein
MKKLMLLCGVLSVVLAGVVSPAAAQSFDPAAYEETSLSGFIRWKDSYSGEEARKFKIPVLYSSASDLKITFTDPGLEEELAFETESPWPPMTSGQKITIYFTTQGPWVWDRHLEAMDYGGGRLVRVGETGALVQTEIRPTQTETAPAQRGGVPASPSGFPGQTRVPAANPTPDEIASSRESPPERVSPGPADFDYGRAPQAGSPRRIVVQISGQTPRQGRYYRLQVGSYSVRGNAARVAETLKNAGLYPAFEEYQNNVRVVLPQVPGEDVVETARKIGGAGFSDVWCREEP